MHGEGLNVEDDAGFVTIACMFDGGLVPGDSFDRTAQIVSLPIVRFPVSAALHASLCDDVNGKILEKEVLGIEQHDQFAEPGDQQRDFIMACDGDFSTDLWAKLLRRYQQALHTLGRVDKQLGQGGSIGVQADIGRMLEYFVGFLRHHHFVRDRVPAWPPLHAPSPPPG